MQRISKLLTRNPLGLVFEKILLDGNWDRHCNMTVRRWVCSKQEYRPQKWLEEMDSVQEPRAITRERCLAAFHVGYDWVKGNGLLQNC